MTALDLDSAKEHLNITRDELDVEVTAMVRAAEAAITQRVGPLERVDLSARVGGGSVLLLPVSPVVSITSITAYGGTVLAADDYHLDTEAGIVSSVYGRGCYSSVYYDVEYVAGRASCPPDLLMAVKELLRHLWGTQHGGSQRPGSQPSDATSNTIPGAAYLFPFRVEQLLAPHERMTVA